MHQPSASDLHDRHRALLARIDERTGTAWREYLTMTRAALAASYTETETFAWRRLRRSLAALAADRRRADFERDRELAELHGTRRAA